jgi:hypothetical protein
MGGAYYKVVETEGTDNVVGYAEENGIFEVTLLSTIVDAVNTAKTTDLIPGLAIKSDGDVYTGTGTPLGILIDFVDTLDAAGVARAKRARIAIRGVFDATKFATRNPGVTVSTFCAVATGLHGIQITSLLSLE